MADPKPIDRSGDSAAMLPYWQMVETILGGSDAIKAAGKACLPKFANESDADYRDRLDGGKFTNIFRDIVEGLAAKPFAKQVELGDGASEEIKAFAEDIDGQGNHIHVFAGVALFNSIANGLDWILVDKTAVQAGATLAEERAAGARPYWVRVPAVRMLAVYSAMIGGTEQFVHARIHEPERIRDGFGERVVNRVRVLNREIAEDAGRIVSAGPATWELFEEQQKANTLETEWVSIGSGEIAIGIIPLAPVLTGRREEGSWRLMPPMKDAAHLQIKHYQGETNLEYAKALTAFPMLTASGVVPPTDSSGEVQPVPVGPKSVLYAPPNSQGQNGEWKFIEITAESLKFLADEIKRTEQQLRELGRQPLTAQTGNLTVVTTAFAAQKGNSAVQAWALNLKDALEQALKITSLWLGGNEEPEVTIYTDFDVAMESDKAADVLLEMRKTGDISREALIIEAKRRDWLSSDYDADEDLQALIAEIPGEEEIQASLTPPANPVQ
jgi:hypothetical protein